MKERVELLERFAQGDPEAFEVLFREHQRDVHSWIYRIVRDRGEAEDLTVEAFMRIYRARARFDPTRKFGPWARRIATNLALNRLRSWGRQRSLTTEPRAVQTASVMERWVLRQEIACAFGELSPRLRLVATLALVEEIPYGEIADGLGLSREAVKSRVFRAVRQLRQRLRSRGIRP